MHLNHWLISADVWPAFSSPSLSMACACVCVRVPVCVRMRVCVLPIPREDCINCISIIKCLSNQPNETKWARKGEALCAVHVLRCACLLPCVSTFMCRRVVDVLLSGTCSTVGIRGRICSCLLYIYIYLSISISVNCLEASVYLINLEPSLLCVTISRRRSSFLSSLSSWHFLALVSELTEDALEQKAGRDQHRQKQKKRKKTAYLSSRNQTETHEKGTQNIPWQFRLHSKFTISN